MSSVSRLTLSRSSGVRPEPDPIAEFRESASAAREFELGTSPSERYKETSRALAAPSGELAEPLIDEGEPSIDLPSSAATPDPGQRRAARARKRYVGAIHIGGQRFRRVGSRLADAHRSLVHKRRDRCRLGADPRANLLERQGCSVEQGIERRGKGSSWLCQPFPWPRSRRFRLLPTALRAGPQLPQEVHRSSGCGQQARRSAFRANPPARPSGCRWSAAARSAFAHCLRQAANRGGAPPYRCAADSAARSSASPCRFSLSLLLSSPSAMLANLPVASSPSCIRRCAIVVSSALLSSMRREILASALPGTELRCASRSRIE